MSTSPSRPYSYEYEYEQESYSYTVNGTESECFVAQVGSSSGGRNSPDSKAVSSSSGNLGLITVVNVTDSTSEGRRKIKSTRRGLSKRTRLNQSRLPTKSEMAYPSSSFATSPPLKISQPYKRRGNHRIYGQKYVPTGDKNNAMHPCHEKYIEVDGTFESSALDHVFNTVAIVPGSLVYDRNKNVKKSSSSAKDLLKLNSMKPIAQEVNAVIPGISEFQHFLKWKAGELEEDDISTEASTEYDERSISSSTVVERNFGSEASSPTIESTEDIADLAVRAKEIKSSEDSDSDLTVSTPSLTYSQEEDENDVAPPAQVTSKDVDEGIAESHDTKEVDENTITDIVKDSQLVKSPTEEITIEDGIRWKIGRSASGIHKTRLDPIREYIALEQVTETVEEPDTLSIMASAIESKAHNEKIEPFAHDQTSIMEEKDTNIHSTQDSTTHADHLNHTFNQLSFEGLGRGTIDVSPHSANHSIVEASEPVSPETVPLNTWTAQVVEKPVAAQKQEVSVTPPDVTPLGSHTIIYERSSSGVKLEPIIINADLLSNAQHSLADLDDLQSTRQIYVGDVLKPTERLVACNIEVPEFRQLDPLEALEMNKRVYSKPIVRQPVSPRILEPLVRSTWPLVPELVMSDEASMTTSSSYVIHHAQPVIMNDTTEESVNHRETWSMQHSEFRTHSARQPTVVTRNKRACCNFRRQSASTTSTSMTVPSLTQDTESIKYEYAHQTEECYPEQYAASVQMNSEFEPFEAVSNGYVVAQSHGQFNSRF